MTNLDDMDVLMGADTLVPEGVIIGDILGDSNPEAEAVIENLKEESPFKVNKQAAYDAQTSVIGVGEAIKKPKRSKKKVSDAENTGDVTIDVSETIVAKTPKSKKPKRSYDYRAMMIERGFTEEQIDNINIIIAGLPIKVSEKGSNLIAVLADPENNKLSVFTKIVMDYIFSNPDDFVKQSDVVASMVGRYSIGTARSQTQQIFTLFKALEMVVVSDNKIRFNPCMINSRLSYVGSGHMVL